MPRTPNAAAALLTALALTLPATAAAAAPSIPSTPRQARAAGATVLFHDEFTGHHLKRAWKRQTCHWTRDEQTSSHCDPAAARLDGHGHLTLDGNPTTGVLVGTFNYEGTTWPVPRSRIGAGWHTPFTVSVRMRVPEAPGWAATAWLHNLNLSRDIVEADFAEPRTTFQDKTEGYYHLWHATTPPPSGWNVFGDHYYTGAARRFTDGSTLGGRYHTWTATVTMARTTYLVDGLPVWQGPGIHGWSGLQLELFPGKPGSWVAGHPDTPGYPPAGPARSWIDSVLVTRPPSAR